MNLFKSLEQSLIKSNELEEVITPLTALKVQSCKIKKH